MGERPNVLKRKNSTGLKWIAGFVFVTFFTMRQMMSSVRSTASYSTVANDERISDPTIVVEEYHHEMMMMTSNVSSITPSKSNKNNENTSNGNTSKGGNTTTTSTTSSFIEGTVDASNGESIPSLSEIQNCFPYNSKEWLSSRFGNVQEGFVFPTTTSIDDDMSNMDSNDKTRRTRTTTTNIFAKQILSQSICDPNSAFVNPLLEPPPSSLYQNGPNDNEKMKDENILSEYYKYYDKSNDYEDILQEYERHWIVRLMYLAIQFHQYRPAYREMEQRWQLHQKYQQQQSSPQDSFEACAARTEGYFHPLDGDNKKSYKEGTNNESDFLHKIGKHDYECKDTKYLVQNVMSGAGMGAVFRMGVTTTLLAGLAMNRTVVLLNAAPKDIFEKRAPFLVKPWALNGCKDRKDYQCYFLPLSPCVPSIDDLQNAPIITTLQDANKVQQYANFSSNPEYEQSKVVIMVGGPNLVQITNEARKRAAKRMKELLHERVQLGQIHIPQYMLDKFLNITQLWFRPGEIKNQKGSAYNQGRSLMHAASLLYLLRPNDKLRKRINDVITDSLPGNFSSDNSFGMPIRASDKCNSESVCLLFEEYMDLVVQQRNKYHTTMIPRIEPIVFDLTKNETKTTIRHISKPLTNRGNNNGNNKNDIYPLSDIILTSESERVIHNRLYWENITKTSSSSSSSSTTFPFRFVINQNDTMQGTGASRTYGRRSYDVMVSSLAAIQLQLHSKHLVGNCCSTFHQLLMDIVKTGCGVSTSPTFECMQELDDENFRLCCSWTKGKTCRKRRKKFKNRVVQMGREKFH